MAEEVKKPAKKEVKYFVNRLHSGGGFIVDPGDGQDPATQVKVRFTPFFDMWKGDTIKVGYLESDDPRVHKALENAQGVEEIKQSEYEKAVGKDGEKGELNRAPLPVA